MSTVRRARRRSGSTSGCCTTARAARPASRRPWSMSGDHGLRASGTGSSPSWVGTKYPRSSLAIGRSSRALRDVVACGWAELAQRLASAPSRARRAAWVASASSCSSVGSPLSSTEPVAGGVKVHWPSASGAETCQPRVLRRWQGGQNRRPAWTVVVRVSAQSSKWSYWRPRRLSQPWRAQIGSRHCRAVRCSLVNLPAEVDDLGDLGALGDDGGEEGVVHPLLHDRHGDRAEPGDLAGLPVDRSPSEQRLEVDPDDDLGVGPGRHWAAVTCAGEELGGGVERVGVGGFGGARRGGRLGRCVRSGGARRCRAGR